MLKNILAVTGKPGLYKLVSRGNSMLIVESLVDKKRMPTYQHDKIISLADVSMFTTGDDIPLSEVLTKLGEKQSLKRVDMDLKNATTDALREFFATILPNFDRDRVYPSDIRKLIAWYNILVDAGITDFSAVEEQDDATAAAPQVKEESKVVTPKTTGKTKTKAAAGSTKTGVGAKKG